MPTRTCQVLLAQQVMFLTIKPTSSEPIGISVGLQARQDHLIIDQTVILYIILRQSFTSPTIVKG
ncbi:hypothetical protein N7492_001705 [Penicillium capsulatum]|uniref:Uncharacterized protein n=1 Tax=Penicillium capsulatum TaxID=69766 RepID=A0A9W9M0J0_9EURO|nr:hypothetical protein N7492_001705 [Penicillium capsulatum]